jgi:hypothetical protein
MTDEQKWLLQYGSGWVGWWDVADKGNVGELGVDPLFERLRESDKFDVDKRRMQVRLKKGDQ